MILATKGRKESKAKVVASSEMQKVRVVKNNPHNLSGSLEKRKGVK